MKTTGELQTSFNFGEGSSPAPVIPTKLDLIFEIGAQRIRKHFEDACQQLDQIRPGSNLEINGLGLPLVVWDLAKS